MLLKRMWINQPSRYQLHHKLHGTNVLADFNDVSDGIIRIYFTSGDVVSQNIQLSSLSRGWVNQK